MPPRFAYWTLLIDNGPTAFRARDAADLLPTLNQLKRKNPNVVLKWFSGGQLWDSPEAATEARRRRPARAADKRGAGGGAGGHDADAPRAVRASKLRGGAGGRGRCRELRGRRGPPVRRGGRRREMSGRRDPSVRRGGRCRAGRCRAAAVLRKAGADREERNDRLA